MINKKMRELLKNREFLNVATCDFDGKPNVVPKFLLKTEGNSLYLADYVIGRTWNNLKVNPKVSLCFMDLDTLTGYQLNGKVEIIEKGQDYDKLLNELTEKEVSLSAKRVIDALGSGRRYKNFEVSMADRILILKVNIEEVVEITSHGKLNREQLL